MKINSLKNNVILNNCLFVFDKLANNLFVWSTIFLFLTSFPNFLRNCITTIPGAHNSIYLIMFLKLANAHMFGSNSIKIKLTHNWNKVICKIHFSSFFFFSFYRGFISWPFTNHNTAKENEEGITVIPHYHFHPLHRQLDISWVITAERRSPLHIGSSWTQTWEPLPSEHKLLTT